jgi:maltose-binding protein MalE
MRTFRIQSAQHQAALEDRRNQHEAERRTQAALVSAWWRSGGTQWGAYVRNASQAPVYQVHLALIGADDRKTIAKIDAALVPPSDQPVFYSLNGVQPEGCRTRLTFTDAAGARWIRDEYGRLDELRSELIMWIGEDIATTFVEFQEDIQSSYGVKVKLDTTDIGERLRQKYILEARRAGNVDVFVGPHDWVGELVAEHAAEPVVLSEGQRRNLSEGALRSFVVDGQIYGIPTTIDTVVLIRNTDLVGGEPASFEEIVAAGRALQRAGTTTEVLVVRVGAGGDPFLVWPVLSSAGAWIFGTTAGGEWDRGQLGIDSAETISAFRRLGELGEAGAGILRREIDQEWVERAFLGRTCPFMLGTYGDVARARDAGIRVAVSDVPAFRDGEPSKPFTSIYGFYVAPFGRNRVLAGDLLTDYLTRLDVMSALSARIGAPVTRKGATVLTDAATTEFLAVCTKGRATPSFPEMPAVWKHLGRAEADVIAGHDPELAVRRAADAVRQAIM